MVVALATFVAGCTERDAGLEVSKDTINFGTELNQTEITVRNTSQDRALTSGVATLEFEFTTDQAWVNVSPASGRCGEGEESAHVVEIDRSLLVLGNNVATIKITSNGGSASVAVRAVRDAPVCSEPPTVPWNPVPFDDSAGTASGVDLVWSDGASRCPGLTATYDVYFGTTSPPPFDHNNGTSKTWDPGILANGTAYYWRVVAKDANGSTSGAEWNFVTDVAPCTAQPLVPATPTPIDDATAVGIYQHLSWSGGNSQCAGQTATYDVYFGTASPPPFHHNNGTSKTWDPGTLVNGTAYYWRVVAKDANGSTSGVEWNFVTDVAPCTAQPLVPATPTPIDDATGVWIYQHLSWSGGNSQCAGLTATYDVYFGTASPPPFHHNNGTSKTWDPGTLVNGTAYYWRVVAKDANGSTSGAEWNFATDVAPCTAQPLAPVGATPIDDATAVGIYQHLSWNGGTSQCAGLTATYDVYFGTASPPPFHHNNGTSKTWDPGTLVNGTAYYWRVVAKDANGSTSGAEWNFTTDVAACATPPTTACTPSPTDGRENVHENSNLAWQCGVSTCPGLVATYDVYLGTTPDLGAAQRLGNTFAKTWDLPRLERDTTYYWRIVTKDSNGDSPGPLWTFTTRD